MKFIYLVQRIGPYHKARFDKLSKQLALVSDELVVLEVAKSDSIYKWDSIIDFEGSNYKKITLFQSNYEDINSVGLFIRLFKALKLEKANVVYIPGWGSREARFALFCSKILGFKSIVMSDSSEFDFQRNKLKEFIKKCFVNQFDAAFVAGSSHFNYILKLGMSANKITMGYDVVDNNHFSSHRSNVYKPDGYFLASGRFIKRKNFILLLEAYKDYRSKVKVLKL